MQIPAVITITFIKVNSKFTSNRDYRHLINTSFGSKNGADPVPALAQSPRWINIGHGLFEPIFSDPDSFGPDLLWIHMLLAQRMTQHKGILWTGCVHKLQSPVTG